MHMLSCPSGVDPSLSLVRRHAPSALVMQETPLGANSYYTSRLGTQHVVQYDL